MDKDRIAGSAKKIKGSVKETIGKATGDTKLQRHWGRQGRGEGCAEEIAALPTLLHDQGV